MHCTCNRCGQYNINYTVNFSKKNKLNSTMIRKPKWAYLVSVLWYNSILHFTYIVHNHVHCVCITHYNCLYHVY